VMAGAALKRRYSARALEHGHRSMPQVRLACASANERG
jgi:hypothetical protein